MCIHFDISSRTVQVSQHISHSKHSQTTRLINTRRIYKLSRRGGEWSSNVVPHTFHPPAPCQIVHSPPFEPLSNVQPTPHMGYSFRRIGGVFVCFGVCMFVWFDFHSRGCKVTCRQTPFPTLSEPITPQSHRSHQTTSILLTSCHSLQSPTAFEIWSLNPHRVYI